MVYALIGSDTDNDSDLDTAKGINILSMYKESSH